MNRWLIKSDPEEYSAKDLEREGRTFWDGVANPLALKHIRSMAAGDEVLIYHTGDERAVVATAKVASKPVADPKDKSGKISQVEIEFAGWLATPVSLDQIKADATMGNWELVKISRLSVMPVPKGVWDKVQKMSAG